MQYFYIVHPFAIREHRITRGRHASWVDFTYPVWTCATHASLPSWIIVCAYWRFNPHDAIYVIFHSFELYTFRWCFLYGKIISTLPVCSHIIALISLPENTRYPNQGNIQFCLNISFWTHFSIWVCFFYCIFRLDDIRIICIHVDNFSLSRYSFFDEFQSSSDIAYHQYAFNACGYISSLMLFNIPFALS